MLPPHSPIAPAILSISFHLSLWGERFTYTRVRARAHTHAYTNPHSKHLAWGNCPHSIPCTVFPLHCLFSFVINSKFSNDGNPHSWPLSCLLLFWGHLHRQNLHLIRLTDELLCSSLCLSHPLLYFLLSSETSSLSSLLEVIVLESSGCMHTQWNEKTDEVNVQNYNVLLPCGLNTCSKHANTHRDRHKEIHLEL